MQANHIQHSSLDGAAESRYRLGALQMNYPGRPRTQAMLSGRQEHCVLIGLVVNTLVVTNEN